MPITFNVVLQSAGISLADVRLIRHKDNRAARGRSPYELWRDKPAEFESYQATQHIARRGMFTAPFWAVFIANLNDETMFAGLYSAKYLGLIPADRPRPHMDGTDAAGSLDLYELAAQDKLADLKGRLFIEWGPGKLAWVQYAERNDKVVTELRREFREPSFPGYLNFIRPLSGFDNLPVNWVDALRSARGVYLLTCPKTKEQYVGSAIGADGFWGRWLGYVQTGHGGNVGLKGRDPSDYQVSILEVAGSAATDADILQMEGLWQAKLQTREMGLNRNVAGLVPSGSV